MNSFKHFHPIKSYSASPGLKPEKLYTQASSENQKKINFVHF